MKNFKGITLIALIITIIVMLILAGVSISMVVGENGILTQAEIAISENKKAKIKEEIELWKAEYKIQQYLGSAELDTENLKEKLKQDGIITEEESETMTEDGITIDGEYISFRDEKTGKLSDILKQGDYVDYPVVYDNISVPSGTLGVAELTSDLTGWRVLGKSGDGDDATFIIITAGTPEEYYQSGSIDESLDYLTDSDNWSKYVDTEYAEGFAYGGILTTMFNSYDLRNNTTDLIKNGTSYWICRKTEDGELTVYNDTYGWLSSYETTSGLRPVVSLKGDSYLRISGGDGSATNPYKLEKID